MSTYPKSQAIALLEKGENQRAAATALYNASNVLATFATKGIEPAFCRAKSHEYKRIALAIDPEALP